jgi:hypothetical protein
VFYENTSRDRKSKSNSSLIFRIQAEAEKRPRRMSEPSADPEDLKLLSPDERHRREKFEAQRKNHYNEFQAVKMARQLMEEEGEEEESGVAVAQGAAEAAAADGKEPMEQV